MEMIEWDGSLLLGVEDMDSDHHDLVVCFNDLSLANFTGEDVAVVSVILQKLVDHTREHFRHEEALMRRYAYPNIDSHKQEHETLLFSVLMFQQRALEADKHPISGRNLMFLASWLLNHIMEADKVFARFILQARVASAACDSDLQAA